MRAAGWPRVFRQQAGGRSVVEVGGQRRVEDKVWDGLGLGKIEGRGLVEAEVSLGWPTGGRDRGRSVGQLEMFQDGEDDGWVGEEGRRSKDTLPSRIDGMLPTLRRGANLNVCRCDQILSPRAPGLPRHSLPRGTSTLPGRFPTSRRSVLTARPPRGSRSSPPTEQCQSAPGQMRPARRPTSTASTSSRRPEEDKLPE